MTPRIFSKTSLYVLWSLAGLVLTFAVVTADWYAAKYYTRASDGTPLRLRYYIAARRDIFKGTQIYPSLVYTRLGLVSESTHVMAGIASVTHKYALADIKKDAAISPTILSDRPNLKLPLSGAVVPIEIRSEFSEGLRPGMLLAFVQERKILPAKDSYCRGFPLIFMTASPDQKRMILKVEVPSQEILAIPLLATGHWQPVIVSNGRRGGRL